MPLNKQSGNMFEFISHTWNPIKGRCSHNCSYCYMKPFWKSEVHVDNKELETNLSEGNFIFVGSSTDMFAEDVNGEWIKKTLDCCAKFKNTYLFQTKNVKRLKNFIFYFEDICRNGGEIILGTTIETNRIIPKEISKAPSIKERVDIMKSFSNLRKMITIEPIMDFDIVGLTTFISTIKPEFVNIGADSKGHNLPEPSAEKIGKLIKELKKFTKVNLKDNLKRIYSAE